MFVVVHLKLKKIISYQNGLFLKKTNSFELINFLEYLVPTDKIDEEMYKN